MMTVMPPAPLVCLCPYRLYAPYQLDARAQDTAEHKAGRPSDLGTPDGSERPCYIYPVSVATWCCSHDLASP
jgi:hypothetical protein